MHTSLRRGIFAASLSFALALIATGLFAQSSGSAGTISGTVTDPSGAVIANATVTLANPISGFSRTATTDTSGAYTIAKSDACNHHQNPLHVGGAGVNQASRGGSAPTGRSVTSTPLAPAPAARRSASGPAARSGLR